MKRRRTEKMTEGANGWTEWRAPQMLDYRLVCCDCGLTHDFEFKVVAQTRRENNEGDFPSRNPDERNLRVVFRARRNRRATAARRRAKP